MCEYMCVYIYVYTCMCMTLYWRGEQLSEMNLSVSPTLWLANQAFVEILPWLLHSPWIHIRDHHYPDLCNYLKWSFSQKTDCTNNTILHGVYFLSRASRANVLQLQARGIACFLFLSMLQNQPEIWNLSCFLLLAFIPVSGKGNKD